MVANTDAEAATRKEKIPHDHLFMVTGLSATNLEKLGEVAAPAAAPAAADFERAIAAARYGRFQALLLLCTLPAFWSAVSVTSATSYIFTRAQCHMDLSLVDMGTLNAITYGGMITSALMWGFLSDTLGRRRIMMWGFLATGLVEVCAAMSQNFTMLLITRFTCGFIFNGPFAVLVSYTAEVHRAAHRARVILLTSLFYTVANTTLPLLAWALLTTDLDIYLFEGRFVIHSWNLFLLATAMVPLLTGVAFFCLPESPKFLMSRGRNQEALEVFQKIFAMNTGRPKEEYPVTVLEEVSQLQGRGVAALRAGGRQLRPLLRWPLAPRLALVCAIHVGLMFGSNTLRLWYPQLAALLSAGAGAGGSLCAAIAASAAPAAAAAACAPVDTDMLTYLQSAVVGTGSVLTYSVGGLLINKCGKKSVAAMCAALGGLLAALLPLLGGGAGAVAALVAAALALTSLCSAALSSIVVDLFPTSLRAMAMASFFMCGRLGTISGTITFPALIDFGCYPPFITIAVVLLVIGLATFCLPNTNSKKLE